MEQSFSNLSRILGIDPEEKKRSRQKGEASFSKIGFLASERWPLITQFSMMIWFSLLHPGIFS